MNNKLKTTGGLGEVARVTNVGGGQGSFAAKVKSNHAYNVYMVRVVEMLAEGQTPVELGSETKAINLAEAFNQAGLLATGTYIVMHRVSDKNVFYVKP